MSQLVEVTLTAVAIPFCASVRVPVVVVPARVSVSVVMAMERLPAKIFAIVKTEPTGKATDALAGIV